MGLVRMQGGDAGPPRSNTNIVVQGVSIWWPPRFQRGVAEVVFLPANEQARGKPWLTAKANVTE